VILKSIITYHRRDVKFFSVLGTFPSWEQTEEGVYHLANYIYYIYICIKHI